jgi:hypothetical protein
MCWCVILSSSPMSSLRMLRPLWRTPCCHHLLLVCSFVKVQHTDSIKARFLSLLSLFSGEIILCWTFLLVFIFYNSQVAQSVQCLTMGWTAIVRSPTEAEDFSPNLCSGAHPATCTMGTGGSFPGCKARPGRDADHSPPSSAEVKKE